SIALLKASKVAAAADGRARVYPEDVKALLRPVLAHRMMMTPDAVLRGEAIDDVLDRVVGQIKPPLGISGGAQGGASKEIAGGRAVARRRHRTGRERRAHVQPHVPPPRSLRTRPARGALRRPVRSHPSRDDARRTRRGTRAPGGRRRE